MDLNLGKAGTAVEEKIKRFKADLHLDTTQIVRKHITMGESEVLTQDLHFELRNEVAEHFDINPADVLLVGSGKLGFSLAPQKRYQPFGDSSDLDLAIISDRLFDEVWHSVVDYKNGGRYWPKFNDFKHHFFSGWIRPDKLPPSGKFEFGKNWWKYFNDLTASGKFGPYKIAAGLYRERKFLEKYQSDCVDKCKQGELF